MKLSIRVSADAKPAAAELGRLRDEANSAAREIAQSGATAARGLTEISASARSVAAATNDVAGRIDRATGVLRDATGRDRAADSAAYGRQMNELRSAIDPLFAAGQRYKEGLRQIAEAERLGAVTATQAGAARARLKEAFAAHAAVLSGHAARTREAALAEQAGARAAAEAAAAQAQAAAAAQALRERYVPLEATKRQYVAAIKEVAAAERAGTLTAAEAAAARQRLKEGFAAAAQQARGAAGGFQLAGHQAANLSYQIQDIGVQLSMGTSPFIILAQQGPQIVSALGGVKETIEAVKAGLASLWATIIANPITALAALAGAAALTMLLFRDSAFDVEKALTDASDAMDRYTRFMRLANVLSGEAARLARARAEDERKVSIEKARQAVQETSAQLAAARRAAAGAAMVASRPIFLPGGGRIGGPGTGKGPSEEELKRLQQAADDAKIKLAELEQQARSLAGGMQFAAISARPLSEVIAGIAADQAWIQAARQGEAALRDLARQQAINTAETEAFRAAYAAAARDGMVSARELADITRLVAEAGDLAAERFDLTILANGMNQAEAAAAAFADRMEDVDRFLAEAAGGVTAAERALRPYATQIEALEDLKKREGLTTDQLASVEAKLNQVRLAGVVAMEDAEAALRLQNAERQREIELLERRNGLLERQAAGGRQGAVAAVQLARLDVQTRIDDQVRRRERELQEVRRQTADLTEEQITVELARYRAALETNAALEEEIRLRARAARAADSFGALTASLVEGDITDISAALGSFTTDLADLRAETGSWGEAIAKLGEEMLNSAEAGNALGNILGKVFGRSAAQQRNAQIGASIGSTAATLLGLPPGLGSFFGNIVGGLFGRGRAGERADRLAVQRAEDLNRLAQSMDAFIGAAGGADSAVRALDQEFASLSAEARRLGRDTADLEDAYRRRRQQAVADANNALSAELGRLTGDVSLLWQALRRENTALIDQARADEADLALARRVAAEREREWLDQRTTAELEALGAVVDAATLIRARMRDAVAAISTLLDRQLDQVRDAAQVVRQSARDWRDLQRSLRDAAAALRLNEAVSTLTPQQRLAESRTQYETARAAAARGDLGAGRQVAGAAQSYLEALRAWTGGSQYEAVFSQVQNDLLDLGVSAGALAGAAEYQAELLEQQVRLLEAIRDNLAGQVDEELLQQQLAALSVVQGLLAESNDLSLGLGTSLTGDQQRLRDAVTSVIREVRTSLDSGLNIVDAPAITRDLAILEAGLVGNNSAEAERYRAAIAVLRQTTADGLITAAEAGPTREALSVLGGIFAGGAAQNTDAVTSVIREVRASLDAGLNIVDAPGITRDLAILEAGLVGNNSAEAERYRAAIAVLRQTTADGLITAAEAGPTRDALAVLGGLLASVGGGTTAAVNSQTGQIIRLGDLSAEQRDAVLAGLGLSQTTAQLVATQTGAILTGTALTDTLTRISAQDVQLSQRMMEILQGSTGLQVDMIRAIVETGADIENALREYLEQARVRAEEEARQRAEQAARAAGQAQVDAAGAAARSTANDLSQRSRSIRTQETTRNDQALDQLVSLATGAVRAEYSDRGEGQRDRADALRGVVSGYAQQLQSVLGGQVTGDLRMIVSSKYGLRGELGGERWQGGVNDTAAFVAWAVRTMAGQMTGLSDVARNAVGRANWSDIPSAMDGLARAVRGAQLGLPAYAGGGRVVGPGGGTSDDVLAWLSNGEHVMRAAVANRYGHDVLDQLNAGDLRAAYVLAERKGLVPAAPAFADGGAVTAPPMSVPAPPPVPRIRLAARGGTDDARLVDVLRQELRELVREAAEGNDDQAERDRRSQRLLTRIAELLERMDARAGRTEATGT
jgi:hypothetical protein